MGTRGHRRFARATSPEEIEMLRAAAEIVSRVHGVVGELIEPGVSTKKLDKVAEEFVRDHGAEPAFMGYTMGPDTDPYPATLCVSRNEIVVHGIPGETILEEGDVVAVDVGVVKDGWYGDCAYTWGVGSIDPEKQRLLDVTVEALYKGIEQAVAGKWVYDIGRAIQRHVEAAGFSVVRDLVGHGIGRSLHEDPSIPNFVPNPFVRHKYRNDRLEEGTVICIEPMVNAGTYRVGTLEDGWTVVTEDGAPSAHFEHMVVVREGKAEILTSHIPAPLAEATA